MEFELLRLAQDSALADYTERFPEFREVVESSWKRYRSRFLPQTPDLSLQETHSFQRDDSSPLHRRRGTNIGGEFGDYEILQEIARGGMGIVYKARQKKANRLVALKTIISGQMAGEEEIRRFHREAEAAAALDHPGIVPIYDVGEIHGQHYFSMGFVDGQSLKERLRDGLLPPREAAELVERIAEAIAYAHEKGVIHRDLKPANILLDRNNLPRVTDFGLAKQLHSDNDLTASGQVMGTPSYMPPEQAAGRLDKIGPTADVYSLGAILYELLTGRPPFQAASTLDILRQVIDQEPASLRSLNRNIAADLETICHKCLAKSPTQRYPSAVALQAELKRFLRGEPIMARPVSRTEKAWRWCRRNPTLAMLIAAMVVLLISGTAVSAFFAIKASKAAVAAQQLAKSEGEAKKLAEKRLVQVEKTNDILGSIFKDLDPEAGAKGNETLRITLGERLAAAAVQLEQEDIGEPLAVARMQAMLATSLNRLGYPQKAKELLLKAIETQQELLGPHDQETLDNQMLLVTVYKALIETDKAIELVRVVIAGREASLGPVHPKTLEALSQLAYRLQFALRQEEALEVAEDLVARQRKAYQGDPSKRITGLGALAFIYQGVGRKAEAVSLAEEEWEWSKRVQGPQNLNALRNQAMLALCCFSAGDTLRSIKLYEEVFDARCELVGSHHQDTSFLLQNFIDMGWILRNTDQPALSEMVFRKGLDLCKRVDAKHLQDPRLPYPDYLHRLRMGLFHLYNSQRRHRESRDIVQQAASFSEDLVTAQPDILNLRLQAGEAHFWLGNHDKALEIYSAAINKWPDNGELWRRSAQLRRDLNQLQEARACYLKVLELQADDFAAWKALAEVRQQLREWEQAISCFEKGLSHRPDDLEIAIQLAWLLVSCPELKLRNPSRALELAQAGIATPSPPKMARKVLGVAFYRTGQWKSAVNELERYVQETSDVTAAGYFLAMACWQIDRKDDARDWYNKALMGMQANAKEDAELIQFQAEAKELIEMSESASTQTPR